MQHSAKSLRQKVSRQRFLCRVLFIGHPTKTLPSANPAPGKEKWSLRRRLRHPLLCRVPCQRHPAKMFLIFFQIFFAGCRAGEAPSKDFFYFFIISLPGVAPRRHLAKSFLFFFVISLLGALALALDKAGNSERNSQLCRVLGPGHPAKYLAPGKEITKKIKKNSLPGAPTVRHPANKL